MDERQYVCEKCKGEGRIKHEDGSISVCFDCLSSGRLDVHSKKLPEHRIKL